MKEIEVVLNGEPYRIGEDATIADLLAALKLAPERLAVELNLEILPRSAWSSTRLGEGDKVEVVHFVGGG